MEKRVVSVAVEAVCLHCGWRATTANAPMIAAQHAKRTGHSVRVRQRLEYVIGVMPERRPDEILGAE